MFPYFLVMALVASSSAQGAFSGGEHAPGDSAGDVAVSARYRDCGDGTVSDAQTGLQWEKKTGSFRSVVFCQTFPKGCADPHDVNNRYGWGEGLGSTELLLAALNDRAGSSGDASCFAQHCDWRLPTEEELRTLTIGRSAGSGPRFHCDAAPCIDPGFAAVGGVTAPSVYWSSSTNPLHQGKRVSFGIINVNFLTKSTGAFTRVVRAGVCT